MPKQITVQFDNLPEGADVEVLGLGVYPNGTTSEVSDEALVTYEALGHTIPEGDFVYPVPAPPPEDDSPVASPQGSEETPVEPEPQQAEQAPPEEVQQ